MKQKTCHAVENLQPFGLCLRHLEDFQPGINGIFRPSRLRFKTGCQPGQALPAILLPGGQTTPDGFCRCMIAKSGVEPGCHQRCRTIFRIPPQDMERARQRPPQIAGNLLHRRQFEDRHNLFTLEFENVLVAGNSMPGHTALEVHHGEAFQKTDLARTGLERQKQPSLGIPPFTERHLAVSKRAGNLRQSQYPLMPIDQMHDLPLPGSLTVFSGNHQTLSQELVYPDVPMVPVLQKSQAVQGLPLDHGAPWMKTVKV